MLLRASPLGAGAGPVAPFAATSAGDDAFLMRLQDWEGMLAASEATPAWSSTQPRQQRDALSGAIIQCCPWFRRRDALTPVSNRPPCTHDLLMAMGLEERRLRGWSAIKSVKAQAAVGTWNRGHQWLSNGNVRNAAFAGPSLTSRLDQHGRTWLLRFARGAKRPRSLHNGWHRRYC